MKAYYDAGWRDSMRIRVDFNNMMADYVGANGITEADINALTPQLFVAGENMFTHRPMMRWRELPHNQGDIIPKILDVAKYVRENFDSFVVLGIGGSALGPIAVQQALSHPHYNELPADKRGGPRLYVEDNVDPERLASLLDVIDVEHTAFNVITKSGSTSETMAQLLLFTDLLKAKVGKDWVRHVIATTDEAKGNLIKIAKENSLTTFFVPDGVGGRFSELCPVGLLAAAVCGVDIEQLLSGADYMDKLCCNPNHWENPAFMLAILEYIAMKKGCNVGVMMPYADSLRYISDWYAQLWAESLGKNKDRQGNTVHLGQTPVKALGVTDQHSQVQLYTEGPFDKVITFLGVDKYRCTLDIPHGFDGIPDVAFLSGHSFNELISCEQRATEYAVLKSCHLSKTITLPEVNAFTIGQLLYMFEIQTAFAGELLDIDAFNQPGVEEGKNATYALLGKPGYDEKRRELEGVPAQNPRFVI